MTRTGTFYIALKLLKTLIKKTFVIVIFVAPAMVIAAEPAGDQQKIQQLLNRIKLKQQALQTTKLEPTPEPTPVAVMPVTAPANSQFVDTSGAVVTPAIRDNNSFAPPIETSEPRSDSQTDEPVAGSRFSAGEELILSLSVNELALTDIFVVKSQRSFQLGIGDFFQVIEYPIYVDLTNNTASGWFLNENNTFSLRENADATLQVQVNDKRYTVAAGDFQFYDNDLFIEIDEIAKWFNFDVEVDEANLAVNIASASKFPMESRLSRQQRRISRLGGMSRSVMPHKESPYQAFSSPMLDIQTSVRQTKEETLSGYSVLGNLDLAYLNTEFFLSGSNFDLLNDARLTLSRQSRKSDLLGVLNATEFAFGDVTPVNVGFSRTQQQSRGIYVTNTPLNQLADNRRVNLTGEVQSGWDVELYQNGVLLDRRFTVTEGRYEFNDVALAFGQNDFELVFYGPQGQIETKTESYIIDSNTVKTGQSSYRFSVVDVNKSLFGINDPITDESGYGTLFGAVYDYGITDWLSMGAGTSLFIPKQGDNQQFYTLSANLSFGRLGLLNSAVSLDRDNRSTFSSNFRTRFWDTNWNISHTRDELYSTGYSLTDQTTDTTSVIMDGRFDFTDFPVLSYQNRWQRADFSNGEYTEILENGLGINSQYGSFSHNLIWNKNAISDAVATSVFSDESPSTLPATTLPATANLLHSNSLAGSLQYRKNFGSIFTRFFTSYGIRPETELLSYGASANFPWSSELSSEMRFSYFVPDDQYQLNLGLNWRKDAFHLNTNFNYNERGDWVIGLSARFSVGYEAMNGDIFTSGRSISQSGGAAVRVFEDLNMNGKFDENEPLIQNAKVKAVQSYREGITNEAGVAILTSLYNNVTTDIIVDEASIDGPFMITAIPGVAITARKGFIEQLNFPVVKAGELEGTVYLQTEDAESAPAPYIMLNLLNETGEVVASTRSEYDGLYLFNNVKPGKYSLKVDDAFIDRRGLKTVKNKQVRFSSKGDLIVGVDFTLAPLENAEGYVVSAGQFNSAGMLKVYYHMLRPQLKGLSMQKPFYIRSRTDDKYVLGLAYFERAESSDEQARQQAEEVCALLTSRKLTCQVEYHGFQY